MTDAAPTPREAAEAELAEAHAEIKRWRATQGPFDSALVEMSAMLISAGYWPEPMRQVSDEEMGTGADYEAAVQNIVDGLKLALRAALAPTPAEETPPHDRP